MTVFAAAYLLSGAAALWTSAAIATFFALPRFSRYYSDLRGDADAGPVIAFFLITLSVVALAAAGGYVLVAILTARGMFTARVFTWILMALAVCVAVGTLILNPYRAVPWYQRLTNIVAILTLAFVVTAVVLFVQPASRGYFRAVYEAGQRRRAQPLPGQRLPYRSPMPYPQTAYPSNPSSQPGPIAMDEKPPEPAWPPLPPRKPPES